MLCYRDRMYCPYEECEEFEGCYRALTMEVEEAASKVGSLVDIMMEIPECYKERGGLPIGE